MEFFDLAIDLGNVIAYTAEGIFQVGEISTVKNVTANFTVIQNKPTQLPT